MTTPTQQWETTQLQLIDFGFGFARANLIFTDIGKKTNGFLRHEPGATLAIVVSSKFEHDGPATNQIICDLLAQWQTLLASSYLYRLLPQVIFTSRAIHKGYEYGLAKLTLYRMLE